MLKRMTRIIMTFVCIVFISQFITHDVYAFEPSTAEIDFHNEPKAFDFHNLISFYQPNYFLMFYHTNYPDYRMYTEKRNPGGVKLRNNEIKMQLSAYIPMLRSIFGNENLRFYFAYTQLFLWQLYSPVQFMREVDYEPMALLRYHFAENMFANLTLDHQSNGKGGFMEVSWNRIIGSLQLTSKHWYTEFTLWYPFFPLKADSHSPNSIMYYLGYDKLVVSYNFKNIVLSVEGQNFESGFKRGHIMASLSYSATSRMKLYLQYFSGYGQSLIEFDHHTTSYGIGFALSDWQ